jgi:indolepyruvate ferredoxin oxidoreductase
MNKAATVSPNKPTRAKMHLDDKYEAEQGRVYITGTQALVRLPMMQRRRDEAAGLNTACLVTGYRGSPLGGVDQQFQAAQKFLDHHHIRIQPAVNEDLAATAIWGTQQLALSPGARYDGVFSMWYGKGPGVDRTGDVFKHGNLSGAAENGGVLAVFGDDHGCKSSTTAHQSEFAFVDAGIPILSPAGVQEFLDLGIYGWAMSRFTGGWVSMKTVADTVDCAASVHVDPGRTPIHIPTAAELGFEMPEGGLNFRWPDQPVEQEERLRRFKIPAALAFARANKFDRQVMGKSKARLGLVTSGKAYLDTRQALEDLGITPELADEIGLAVYKVGMPWPLEPDGIRAFASAMDEILVIEEKRSLIESQIKEQLYHLPADQRPRIVGKTDEQGAAILKSDGELTPAMIGRVIAARIERFHQSTEIDTRIAFLEQKEKSLERDVAPLTRTPHFCSGCPHNSSTIVPEGSRAFAGIGCHYMASWMDRRTETFTHMGGEGASWVGISPFTDENHIYVNLGDGTYFHSGVLAVRQAVAANVNMTVKLLYNDAVAMTGGQPLDGNLTVPMITRQLEAEGVKKIIVVAEDPAHYTAADPFARGVTVHDRTDFARLQRELRDVPGVTALIYDQTCAAEKRRRRKRGLMEDPAKRVYINQAVCEGCGDCSVQSNCLSVIPVETEFGRKRAIDQSTCNKDYSCLKGFCPSFVTVEGGALRTAESDHGPNNLAEAHNEPDIDALTANLPRPQLAAIDKSFNCLLTGIGGTGVVTLGAVIAAAAHIEGKGVQGMSQTGLAQKGGAVINHIRIGQAPEDLSAIRVPAGGADLILAADLIVAGSFDSLAKMDPGRTHAVVNTHETITASFLKDPNYMIPGPEILGIIGDATHDGSPRTIDASRLATALLGDSIATNIFLLGYAWQCGLLPIGDDAIIEAIYLNAGPDLNRRAFLWGRLAAHDGGQVEALAKPLVPASLKEPNISGSLDEIIERRADALEIYQNKKYAHRYRALVDRAIAAEEALDRNQLKSQLRDQLKSHDGDQPGFADAVARSYHKLLAYKDEYEVARALTDRGFANQLSTRFEGHFRLRFHMAPPLFAKRDPETGHLIKKEFGPWMGVALSALAKLKFLRGTALDPFGRLADRRQERAMIGAYEEMIGAICRGLAVENYRIACDLAALPMEIRGFGHVKEAAIARVEATRAALVAEWQNPGSGPAPADLSDAAE